MIDLDHIGRLPTPQDNCAIAARRLAAGTAVQTAATHFALSHTILEGHRFAIQPIPQGRPLLSWGLPFGRALHDIVPGDYVCNARVLSELSSRALDFPLPAAPNFADDLATYHFDADQFQPAPPLPLRSDGRTFLGIPRPGGRGVGTRNMIVLLGVNELVSGFGQQLEQQTHSLAADYDHIDGIVAVTHTEGGQVGSNNQELLLRTLAGFMVHPNVGAVLVLDAGDVGVTNGMLRHYAHQHGYPLSAVPHQFMSLRGPFAADLARAAAVITEWLPQVDQMRRTPQPLSQLKVALQCGGSDAFSGISGNPLVAWVSKRLIQAGGTAVLAETDELIGAESYVLQKVRNADTAHRFLEMVAQFQERAARHGHSAHGNPSGGNLYRGLYNIYLKSLGAATKRHPDVRLDGVLEYGERATEPGYYFMDSPGNDLESIAGQVAAGCTLIYFVTGNGSITNFPFVPTIKVVTTSARYALLAQEMDINAGAYLEGTPMADLGAATLDLSLAVAAGQPSAGERSHHAQVQIWRNWSLSQPIQLDVIKAQPQPDGRPLAVHPPPQQVDFTFSAWQTETAVVSDRIGLVLPSSLCSGQIAHMAVQRLNQVGCGREKGITRFAALVHTEGCGSSTQPEFVDTLLGYLTHPLVATCLVLEHGCEKTHNDFWRQRLLARGLDPTRFGWASVQLDGGIEPVLAKMAAWFTADCHTLPMPFRITADCSQVRLGVMTDGMVDGETAAALAALCQQIAAAGGTVILPATDPLVTHPAFAHTLPLAANQLPTLAYAHSPLQPGCHLMATPTRQWSEMMTGLGAAGVELIAAVMTTRCQQGHPFIPVLPAAAALADPLPFQADVDVLLTGSPAQRLSQLLAQMSAILSRTTAPHLSQVHNVGFQITRGQLGVSL